MNYNLYFVGLKHKEFDDILKLFILSSRESDYIVKIHSFAPENPKSPKRVLLKLTGSLKKDFRSILIDFDNLVNSSDLNYEIINRQNLNTTLTNSSLHYWYMAGYLLKLLKDVTPAYFTGYLIENGMNSELEAFRKYSL